MAQLNMRIVLRNGSTAEWLASKDVVLYKAEVGVEFLESGKARFKIGDGVTTWEFLPYADANVAVDGTSIVIDGDVISLAGFAEAESGAQLRKAADGTLEWVKPDTTTIEGVQETVAGLESDVDTLRIDLDAVEALVETLRGDSDESIDDRIDAKLNEFATQISDDGIANTYKELVDYVAAHAPEAAEMAADILKLEELVGASPVSDQIASALESIEPGAQVNKVDDVQINGVSVIADKIANIPVAGEKLGVVLSSDAENKIMVAEDGTMEVNAVNVSKLVQTAGEELILYGGNADTVVTE